MISNMFYSCLQKLYGPKGLLISFVCISVFIVVQQHERRKIPGKYSNRGEHDLDYSFGIVSNFEKRIKFPSERPRFDNRRIIQIYEHVRTATEWTSLKNKFDVCLATQTSIERLYWLPEVLNYWNGPVSLAIYIISDSEWIAFNIYSVFLERCYPSYARAVSIHFALPADYSFTKEWRLTSKLHELLEASLSRPCGTYEETKEYLQHLLEQFALPTFTDKDKDKLFKKTVYPQNHLRNIARKGCHTPWTYSVDIDIIPSMKTAELLQQFYEKTSRKCEKCAYIIPTFELDYNSTFPSTKQQIVDYYKTGRAKSLNQFFAVAQSATDFQRWTSTFLTEENRIIISHPITNRTMYYEPFYVSSDVIPPFDERFLGYGLTRSSQFQEALLSGWNFTVLSPVFGIHWGIHKAHVTDKKKAPVADLIRESQRKKNAQLFRKFMKELRFKQKEGLL